MTKRITATLTTMFLAIIANAQSNMAWGEIENQATQFKSTAEVVGKAGAGAVLFIAMIWMIYTLSGESPKKKESVISFLIAAALNTVLWTLL